jgi:hypothetical protein
MQRGGEMIQWNPIGTMPRDGQPYLLFCPDEQPQYVAALWTFTPESGPYLRYVDDNLNDIAPQGPDATHWSEMPEPPQ